MLRAPNRVGPAAAHDIMMMIGDHAGTVLLRIGAHSPRRERTNPECRKNAEKSHTGLLVAASGPNEMETF
jgi:hypothetical protein